MKQAQNWLTFPSVSTTRSRMVLISWGECCMEYPSEKVYSPVVRHARQPKTWRPNDKNSQYIMGCLTSHRTSIYTNRWKIAGSCGKRSFQSTLCCCRPCYFSVCSVHLFIKGAQSRLTGLKTLAKLFYFVVFQSVSIFSILNHPCSFMLCYNLFGVFLSL